MPSARRCMTRCVALRGRSAPDFSNSDVVEQMPVLTGLVQGCATIIGNYLTVCLTLQQKPRQSERNPEKRRNERGPALRMP